MMFGLGIDKTGPDQWTLTAADVTLAQTDLAFAHL
jgi:hypothetical protein